MMWFKEHLMRKFSFDDGKTEKEVIDEMYGWRLGEKGRLGLVRYANYLEDGSMKYADMTLWCVQHVPTGKMIKTNLLPMKMRRSLKTMKEFVEILDNTCLTWSKTEVKKRKKEYDEYIKRVQERFVMEKKEKKNE